MSTIVTKNWGKGKTELNPHCNSVIEEFRPTEIHHKDDGALGDKPSILIVMYKPTFTANCYVYGQVSVDMLTKALSELGYTLSKNP